MLIYDSVDIDLETQIEVSKSADLKRQDNAL
jgi:hypothetical protein